ncbi:uncharacterized protein LOC113238525 [Hyposmocoma kahamanoa]|uniref:uncharacterized protein LOC113238525 n=1 Tax=Hyposmocoma kahamanoa TaxID=1477025 RepID=UPI000E6D6B68|nr:uncharacterized protein LOC113238525 [Hyposmocoma kahamanoa]XP_026331145.1 uncharacterized protein LOC113238525 [Hyposmocoma kahamanoa]
MTEFEFDSHMSDLSVEQRELIANVFKEHEFKDIKIKVQPVGSEGDNFGANVKRIIGEKDDKTFKIIAKIAPKTEMLRVMANTVIFFKNEHVMYTEVLPKFTELEKAANIPKEERLRYATCYGTYLEAPNEMILLEDLEVPGYKMLDKVTSLSDEAVKLVLKNFAMLHSLSYALKYEQRETFEKFCQRLVNTWVLMAGVPEMIDYFEKLEVDVQTLIDDDKYKNAIKNTIGQVILRASELAKTYSSSKFSVIQQGDSWTNNIMFRLEDDRAVECCMIDYQLSKRSSPVADLHCLIFNCTDYATRAKHFYDWIDYYYLQLDKRLAKFELKTEEVYPRYQLEADLKLFAKFSLGHAIVMAGLVFREAGNATELKKAMNNDDPNKYMDGMIEQTKLSTSDPATIKKFKTRLEELVDSFIEFGYINASKIV